MKFSHLIVLLELPVPALVVSPVESVAEMLDRWRAGERVEVLCSDFLDVLALVPDPRDARGRRYLLAGLLAIAILATAAGMRGYAGLASWAATAPPEVLARLGIGFRRPSEKTFRSVLSRLDRADLDRRLGAYFTALAAAETGLLAVAVDGKTLRGARRMGEPVNAVLLLDPVQAIRSIPGAPSFTRTATHARHRTSLRKILS